MAINLERCFQQSNGGEKIEDKLRCRKLLGYVCILKICCTSVLSVLTYKGNLDRIDKHSHAELQESNSVEF